MDSHSVELLEFDYIRRELQSLCIGQEGVKLIGKQDFLDSAESLDYLLDRVVYVQRLLAADLPLPSVNLPEIEPALDYVKKEGASLDGPQIVDIGRFIRGGVALQRWVGKSLSEGVESPFATDDVEVSGLADLANHLFGFFDDDGSVKETLPELKSLRRRIRNTQNEISSLAASYLQNQASIWQTNVPTQKDGRLVLPLKSSSRGRVKGIIREVSSSGATTFIEPFDLVEKNNAFALLEHEYQLEIAKILRACSGRIRTQRDELLILLGRVAYLDAIIARSRFGEKHQCTRALRLERGFKILGGRHPMLGRSAVPIQVELADGSSILIVTGPNAGGKTVTLKTIGLFALMNQFGMCIPADEGSGIQLYRDVLADIGDDQSIEESLSTFSGHMRNISRFVELAASDILVLLDELGSGTDPEEGSALAMAVLDKFLDRGANVITTTHQSVLKNYGFSKDGVINASVAFDSDTHRPTYSIILGLPGESHALEIAASSGMNDEILRNARRYLDEQSTDVAQIIREITAQQRVLNEKESDFEKRRKSYLEQVRETDLRALRLKQREAELRTQGYMQLTKQITESRKQLENLVRELREGELSREKTRAVKDFIDEMEQTVSKERDEIAEVKKSLSPVQDIEPGMEVLVGASKQRGKVIRKARNGFWVVATEKLKVTVAESDIKEIVEEKAFEKRVRVEHSAVATTAVFTLDLRGFRLAQALDELERQIDRAIMANLGGFEVIHGHGEGILKRGIHDRLKSHPSIKSFNFAVPEAGGFGKTVIELK